MIHFDNIKLAVSFRVNFIATEKAPYLLLAWIKDVAIAPNTNSLTFESPQSDIT